MQGEKKLVVLSGNAHKKLAADISAYIGKLHGYRDFKLGNAVVTRFSDQETKIDKIPNVRGDDVFIIQPTCTSANENLMELLVLIDAVRRSSAKRITAVIPYYGYARQDRKLESRVPISAKLVANLLTAAGAKRILTIDLHAGQIQGFFDIPVDNLFASTVILDYINESYTDDIVIVSPDVGGAERARAYAKRLNAKIAIIDKRRPEAGKSEVMNIVGNVDGLVAILIDDMIDTAGTMCKAAKALIENGAKKVLAGASHPVLSGNAIANINESPIEKVLITDTIPLGSKMEECSKLFQLSIAPLLGEAIVRIFEEDSVSELFLKKEEVYADRTKNVGKDEKRKVSGKRLRRKNKI
jgi:ribose-phosphate pyrophosphokinase